MTFLRGFLNVAWGDRNASDAALERNEHGWNVIGDLLGYTKADIKVLSHDGVIG